MQQCRYSHMRAEAHNGLPINALGIVGLKGNEACVAVPLCARITGSDPYADKRARSLKGFERLSPIGLLLLWSINTVAWLFLYGLSFDVRDAVLESGGSTGLRAASAGITITLTVLPLLLLVLTFAWLRSEGLAQRVAGWHVGQVAAAWFVGGFLAVFVSLGFGQLGAGTETLGLIYLLFFLGFSALAVPALLTARWHTTRAETD